MPGKTAQDWQRYRDKGMDPVAQGTAMWSICEVLAEEMPDIAKALLEHPPEDKIKLIALGKGGGTVYDIEPKMDPEGGKKMN